MLNIEIRFTLLDNNERQLFGQFCGIVDKYRAQNAAQAAGVQPQGEAPAADTIETAAEKIDAAIVAEIAPEGVKRRRPSRKAKSEPAPEADPYPETEAEKAAIVQPKAEFYNGGQVPAHGNETKIPTLEQTKEAIQAYANAFSVPAAMEMLTKHGATKLKDLPEDQRAPLIAAMQAALEAK